MTDVEPVTRVTLQFSTSVAGRVLIAGWLIAVAGRVLIAG